MRHAIRNVPETTPDGAAGMFIVGAVLCAAVMVALFAFHGGPDLLGGRFDSGSVTALQSP